MLLGGADDMTPPEPCEQLAARWQRRGHRVELEVYPGAFHGFDGDGALRVRPNIKGGMHQGNDPAAAAASGHAVGRLFFAGSCITSAALIRLRRRKP